MIKLELLGVTSESGRRQHIVLLRHESRILPITVDSQMAEAIRYGMLAEDIGRPLTHDLICNLLAGLRGELKSVAIYKLQDSVFYAHLNIEQKDEDGHVQQVLRVDSRPSDSIAIAVRVGCPIYASEEVMDVASEEMVLEEEGPADGDEADG